MQLRPYQEDLINKTRSAVAKHKTVLMQAPTGAGKTAITVFMMKRVAELGKSAFFIVHQNELLGQTSRALWKQKLEHGQIVSGKVRSKMPIQVASVQTLVNRLDHYKAPDLIIIDEAHRSAASTYRKVLDAYPNAHVVGLTATPQRTDNKALKDLFSGLVIGPSIRQLITAGYLCDYKIYAPNTIEAKDVHTRMGDYAKDELESLMDKPTITGDAVQHYRKFADGKRCVVMCVTLKHAHHVAETYNDNGIPAACIEGKMTSKEREDVIGRFDRGELLVLTNVQLLIEGVDIPRIEVVQWLRHTQSLIVFMQGNGRGFRPAEGKRELLILDHVGNTARHGLPCEDREWSLEGRKKGSRSKSDQEPDVNVQQCGKCYGVFLPGGDKCPYCGAPIEKRERKIIEQEGELQQVDIAAIRKERKREQGTARSLRDLVSLGMRKQMKNPSGWAVNVLAAREGRKPEPADYTTANRLHRELLSEQRN